MDQQHLDLMTGGDVELQAEVFELFEEQSAIWSRLLIPDAPVQTWRDVAHAMKGSARGLGLWALAEQCEAVEALGRCGMVERAMAARQLAAARRLLAESLAAIAQWRDARLPEAHARAG